MDAHWKLAATAVHAISSLALLIFSLSKNEWAFIKLDTGIELKLAPFAIAASLWSACIHLATYRQLNAIINIKEPTWGILASPRWLDFVVSSSLMVIPAIGFAGQTSAHTIGVTTASMAATMILAGWCEETTLTGQKSPVSMPLIVASSLLYHLVWAQGFEGTTTGGSFWIAIMLVTSHSLFAPLFYAAAAQGWDTRTYDAANGSLSVFTKILMHWTTALNKTGQAPSNVEVEIILPLLVALTCAIAVGAVYWWNKNNQNSAGIVARLIMH